MSKLRVWWIPQIPGKSFKVKVDSPDQAVFILNTLADYDLFQLHHNIKPDYCNTGGLEIFLDGEWEEWCDDEGQDVNDIIRATAEADAEPEELTCITCNGSGEGMHDGTTCRDCKGKGVEK